MEPSSVSPPPLGLHGPATSSVATTVGKDPLRQPLQQQQQQQHLRDFDNSVNAVSFGFVATAVLISMFLVMAIFERFLRSTSPEFSNAAGDSSGVGDGRGRVVQIRELEAEMGFNGKLSYPPSPKMTVYTNGVSVLMPGYQVPTFIAHRAPVPCPPERMPWPPHQNVPPSPHFISGPS
ncbi:hypothetical protein MLD38_036987 [Melastoma candidum]|uniref:Uncharacterized protein n=1 Tax=Melastoma candidum TaxID=119954 RepID=A0ACB9LLF4_9MYRT|nr:hypothetical protein MLD38_036987 [Melastoma candidum]